MTNTLQVISVFFFNSYKFGKSTYPPLKSVETAIVVFNCHLVTFTKTCEVVYQGSLPTVWDAIVHLSN